MVALATHVRPSAILPHVLLQREQFEMLRVAAKRIVTCVAYCEFPCLASFHLRRIRKIKSHLVSEQSLPAELHLAVRTGFRFRDPGPAIIGPRLGNIPHQRALERAVPTVPEADADE